MLFYFVSRYSKCARPEHAVVVVVRFYLFLRSLGINVCVSCTRRQLIALGSTVFCNDDYTSDWPQPFELFPSDDPSDNGRTVNNFHEIYVFNVRLLSCL